MATPNYKVGMLVEHPARPQWGLGKIVAIDDLRLHVFFKGEPGPVAKAFMRSLAPLKIAEVQEDEELDSLPKAMEERGSYMLRRTPKQKRADKKEAAERLAAAAK